MSDLREIERASIRAFVQNAADQGYLSGKVLDYGCGQQPYRPIVEAAGGVYHGYDSPGFPASVAPQTFSHLGAVSGDLHAFDTVLCTQVIQYAEDPGEMLVSILEELALGGTLVMTGPTNWPEVEQEDFWRFTQAGIRRLLTSSGFAVATVAPRAYYPNTEMLLGWGAIAHA